tara:strand:+ start:1152 stop:1889 length:738 start_codon:yes stop_codon:yes gene_type:complete
MAIKKTQHKTMAQAVAAAQAEMSNAVKDSTNPHFKKTYASLAAIRDIVIPAYASHGVAVVQEIIGVDGFAGVKTTLYWQGDPSVPRESMPAGELMTPIGTGRNASQDCGSAATYYRRYQLAACAGIAQEDDDASSAPQVQNSRPAAPAAAPRPQNSTPARAAVEALVGVPTSCPKCNGPVWDNRKRKADDPSWRGPFFGCKDKDVCRWAMWNAPESADETVQPDTKSVPPPMPEAPPYNDDEIPF